MLCSSFSPIYKLVAGAGAAAAAGAGAGGAGAAAAYSETIPFVELAPRAGARGKTEVRRPRFCYRYPCACFGRSCIFCSFVLPVTACYRPNVAREDYVFSFPPPTPMKRCYSLRWPVF